MIEWFVRKIVVGKVNSLLKEYEKDVAAARTTLQAWTFRLKKVLGLLESALARLSDNALTPEELEETAKEIKALIEEWR